MDYSRRGFINLLGIGGIGLTMTDRPVMALFGSDEVPSGLIVPDRSLVSGHFVVKPKRFLERVPEAELKEIEQRGVQRWGVNGDARIVGRVVKHREPQRPHLVRNGYLFAAPEVLFEGMTVQDAHSAFYVASHDLREKFAAFTRETLRQVDTELRPMATIVTIADAPIHARPVGLRSPQDEDHVWGAVRDTGIISQANIDREERGFDVVASFRQFVVLGTSRSELTTYETYSEHGEYPVDVPKDVDMGILIKLDREVVVAGANTRGRVGDLLSRFSKSWSV